MEECGNGRLGSSRAVAPRELPDVHRFWTPGGTGAWHESRASLLGEAHQREHRLRPQDDRRLLPLARQEREMRGVRAQARSPLFYSTFSNYEITRVKR